MDELTRALRELDQTSDPIKRHFALQTVVTEAYRLRAEDPKMRELCRRIGTQHLSEFPTIAVALKPKWGYIPLVPTFRCLATLLAEDANFDEAVRVCETAIAHGVRDETTSGFEGAHSTHSRPAAHARNKWEITNTEVEATPGKTRRCSRRELDGPSTQRVLSHDGEAGRCATALLR